MNALNNKPYLSQIVAAFALLFMCQTVGAQILGKTPFDEPPAIVEQPEPAKTEATKPQDIKNVQTVEAQSETLSESQTESIAGIASYYDAKFHGKRTASGEKFNSKQLTAAHLTLPFGTLLKVTNVRNKQSVIVRVNDRGPHVRGRIVDLSRAAAELIGITRTGVARVELEIVKP